MKINGNQLKNNVFNEKCIFLTIKMYFFNNIQWSRTSAALRSSQVLSWALVSLRHAPESTWALLMTAHEHSWQLKTPHETWRELLRACDDSSRQVLTHQKNTWWQRTRAPDSSRQLTGGSERSRALMRTQKHWKTTRINKNQWKSMETNGKTMFSTKKVFF